MKCQTLWLSYCIEAYYGKDSKDLPNEVSERFVFKRLKGCVTKCRTWPMKFITAVGCRVTCFSD